jgi:hypothetical protein
MESRLSHRADPVSECRNGALCGFSEMSFELREGLLDRVDGE